PEGGRRARPVRLVGAEQALVVIGRFHHGRAPVRPEGVAQLAARGVVRQEQNLYHRWVSSRKQRASGVPVAFPEVWRGVCMSVEVLCISYYRIRSWSV